MYNSNLFKLNFKDILSALLSAILVALIGYVLKVGDVWALNFHEIVNTAVMTAGASLLKALVTDSGGYVLRTNIRVK